MIEVGQKKKAKYWGNFTIAKVAKLQNPVKCTCAEIGTALFEPTLVKIDWEQPPSEDRNELWFPYWISIHGKEKYGQFAPMIGEKALLELFSSAINQDFFSSEFLSGLRNIISTKMNDNLESMVLKKAT
jgi:hypothetical protein